MQLAGPWIASQSATGARGRQSLPPPPPLPRSSDVPASALPLPLVPPATAATEPPSDPFKGAGGIGRPSLILDVEHAVAEKMLIALGPLIEREFCFTRSDSDVAPTAAQIFRDAIVHDPALIAMKDELNRVKAQLEDKDPGQWGVHTDFTNICSSVGGQVRSMAPNTEMCTGAFLKLFEILQTYDVVPKELRQQGAAAKLNTVHLAEAPGGFVSAMNHFVRNSIHREAQWQWRGVTLNPYYEGNQAAALIDDDRLLVETRRNWMYGADNSGDIRVVENIRSFWTEVRRMGAVHAVTADGSVSCADQPGEQEALTAQLRYCETVAALGMLSSGGSFVLKCFTFFEHTSQHLLYLLHTLFSSVTVTKPACSKAGNSETYVVCCGFRGINGELLEAMLQRCGSQNPTTMLLPAQLIPSTFLAEMKQCTTYFAKSSAAVIQRNVDLFEQMDRKMKAETEALKTAVAQEWLKRFRFKALPAGCRLFRSTTASVDGKVARVSRFSQAKAPASMKEEESEQLNKKARRNSEDAGVKQEGASADVEMADVFVKPEPPSATSSIAPTPVIYTQKMMEKLGYRPGFGKDDSAASSSASAQHGFMLDSHQFVRYLKAPSALSVASVASSSASGDNAMCTDNDARFASQAEWITVGRMPSSISLSKFVGADILKESMNVRHPLLGQHRAKYTDSPFSAPNYARTLLKGHSSIFHSECALEFAELDALFDFTGRMVKAFAEDGEAPRVLEVSTTLEAAGKHSFGGAEFISQKLHDVEFELKPTTMSVANPGGESAISENVRVPPKCQLLLVSGAVRHESTAATAVIERSAVADLRTTANTKPSDVRANLVVAHSQRIFSMTGPVGNSNIVQHYVSLCQVLDLLSHLSLGGSLCLRTTDLLSRFSASILFALSLLFDSIAVLKTGTMSPVEPEKWIVGLGFHGWPEPLRLHLEGVRERMRRMLEAGETDLMSPSTQSVVEFLPIDLLLQRYFLSFLLETNNRLSHQEVTEAKRAHAHVSGAPGAKLSMHDQGKRDQIAREILEKIKPYLQKTL